MESSYREQTCWRVLEFIYALPKKKLKKKKKGSIGFLSIPQ